MVLRFNWGTEIQGSRFTTNVGVGGAGRGTANGGSGQRFFKTTKVEDSRPTLAQKVQAGEQPTVVPVKDS